MPQRPTNLDPPDLVRLRHLGFEAEVRAGHLLVHKVPYVTEERLVERATLVAPLNIPDGQTVFPPNTHVVSFTGGQPCDRHGHHIRQIVHMQQRCEPVPGIVVQRSFSNKPNPNAPGACKPAGYCSYAEMMARYAGLISAPATALDPDATARTFAPRPTRPEENSPHVYHDTASSRAGIADLARRVAVGKVAIIGLGGTGGYVLDLLAKTFVPEIHLYDGDRFDSHNAFRAPGAASLSTLSERSRKVDYFASVYAEMHTGIKPHPEYLTRGNVDELTAMAFVFICLDKGEPKRFIAESLESAGVPFVDVGMGLYLDDERQLGGQVRVTASTREDRGTFLGRVSFQDPSDEEALYDQNIQAAELNMLNAALAVVRWKKLLGIYRHDGGEHHTIFDVNEGKMYHG